MTTISIVTPSYQQGQYIERTIQSVLSQGIPVEYIIMDGGSRDETPDIVEKYASQLTFVSEKDKGQADAVNKGLKKATGDIIGWLNSDDIYYPNTLKKVLNYFAEHPDIDVVYGDAYHIDQHDQLIELYPTESWNIERLKRRCFISQPTVFWRRKVMEQHGYLNDTLHFCLDYEYWLRLGLQQVRFGYLRDILAGSRLYPETKTLSSPLKAQHEALSMVREKLGFIPREWLVVNAVTELKHTSQLRYPSIRFIIATWFRGVYQTLEADGYIEAFKALVCLPWTMVFMKLRR